MTSDPNPRSAGLPSVEYKIYVLDGRNQIFRPAQLMEAINDKDAIEKATQLFNGRTIEVWDGTRLIIRHRPDISKAQPVSLP